MNKPITSEQVAEINRLLPLSSLGDTQIKLIQIWLTQSPSFDDADHLIHDLTESSKLPPI
jgi:hypothetical protein